MRATRFVVGLVGLLAAATWSRAGAQTTVAWSYTMNMTTDSGNGRQPTSMAIRQQVTDRYLRMETVQISGMTSEMGSIEGSFMLLDSVDSTMTNVIPSHRMATVMALGSTMETARSMNMHIKSDTKSSIEDLGPGGRIMGHDTHHYRSTTSGTIEISFGSSTCVMPADMVNDMWIAPDVDMLPAMQAMLQRYGMATTDIVTQSSDTRTAATGAAIPKGTALRTISRRTRRDAQGTVRTVTSTMEYSGLSHGPVSTELFAVPAGYKTMDMRKMLANLPAGMMDSITAAGSGSVTDRLCDR